MKPTDVLNWIGNNDTKVFRILFILTILWILPGLFPLVSYEGDATSISYGCEFTATHGWHTLGQEGYGFWMQPLMYIIIIGLSEALHCACEPAYSLFTSCCGIALIYATVIFCSKLTGIRKYVILTAIIFIPESIALTMYPNSTAPAALLVVLGFIQILENRNIIATIALCVAPLIRLDVCTIYPMVPFLFYIKDRSFSQSITRTVVLALEVCLVVSVFYAAIGASIATTCSEFTSWSDRISKSEHYSAIFGFYGFITLILFPIGIYELIKSRNNVLTLMIASAFIIIHLVNIRFGNASKHYALLIPYTTIVNAYGLLFLRNKNWLKWVYSLLILGILNIGLYAFKGTTHWKAEYSIDKRLSKFNLFEIKTTFLPKTFTLSFRIGPGRLISTGDELFILGGYLFYPYTISKVKKTIAYRIHILNQEILPLDITDIMGIYWNDYTRLQLENQRTLKHKNIVYYNRFAGVIPGEKFEKSVEVLNYFWIHILKKENPL